MSEYDIPEESDLELSIDAETEYTDNLGSNSNYSSYYLEDYSKLKIIEGPVRITTEKFCKVGQYIMAALCPQWNMPTLSKMDLDTLSVQISNHVVIDKKYK